MKRLALSALVSAFLFSHVACRNAAADPLAGQRATCEQLARDKQLKPGLSIDACVKELQANTPPPDPMQQAEELTDRLQQLVAALHQRREPSQEQQIDVVVAQLQKIGKPAVPPSLSMMTTSIDPELRAPLARVLTSVCAADCAQHRFECIVPALLEGTTGDKPEQVRKDSVDALARCTGEKLGNDPAAWRNWWSARETGAAR